jgi:hypothetical protein
VAFLCLSVLVSLCSLALLPAASAAQSPPRQAPPQQPQTLRVLFIGNSYTYFHNLPEIVQTLAAGMTPARRVEVERVTVGGATLFSHWTNGRALAALRGSHWDYVVLQEQSTLGGNKATHDPIVTNPNQYLWPYVRLFDDEIKKQGAKTVLMQTWGRKSSPVSYDALAYAYMTIGRERQALVIPAGRAWQLAQAATARQELTLYEPDGSHPSPVGSYLAALTVLSALFDVDPGASGPLPLRVTGRGPDDDGGSTQKIETLVVIDAYTFARLRRAAWTAWTEVKRAGGYLTITPPAAWAEAAAPPPSR